MLDDTNEINRWNVALLQYQPVLGNELVGKDSWKKMIDGFAKSWETTIQKSHIAVSAGDKVSYLTYLRVGSHKQ